VLLVDASAWVLSGIRPDVLLEIGGGDELAVSPPIMSEILRGSHDEVVFQETRKMFLQLRVLDSPLPLERFEEAARLYMMCRDKGVTVRKGFDCLIAATAVAHDVTVLHRDSDFDNIARVMPLKAKRI
jgi:predicted nucleic acid-binding protein